MESRYPAWIVIAEFADHPRAELAKNLLENHKLHVRLWSDDCGGLAGGQTFIQRVRLFVPGSEEQAAREILGSAKRDG
jgi:hypothetical protein